MLLIIKNLDGQTYDIEISNLLTISDLKYIISDLTNSSKELIVLVDKGLVLVDERTIDSYGLKNGSLITMVIKKPKEINFQPKKKKKI